MIRLALLLALSLPLSGCAPVAALFGIGVYGAVKDAQGWVRTPCGTMTKNSPYPSYVVCDRLRAGAEAFDVPAVDVDVEWRESTCTPSDGKAGPCGVLPYSGEQKVAGYQSGSRSVVVFIHPDPFAPVCRTALAHEGSHVALGAAGKRPDLKHERPEWRLVNGCHGG